MEKYKELEMLKKIALEFSKKGGKLYYVGGFVRDKILGIENKDFDVEIHDLTYSDSIKILEKFGTIDLVGANFGVIKIHGLDIDFAFPRKENSIGGGHKDFEINIEPFISTKEACIRRDFTINAIMQNVLTGEIIDNFNGISDLNKKLIKHINSNSFTEDPLRVLRACSFASRFEFDIDQNTKKLCRTINIKNLSKERIFEEIKKALLKSKKPSLFIKELIDIEKFEDIFFTSKNNKLITDQITNLYTILDNSAKFKKTSNNPELFMLTSLIYGLNLVISNFEFAATLEKLSYKKDLNKNVLKLLNATNFLININCKINDYELRKLAVFTKTKFFNIDDVLLFNKSLNSDYNIIMENRINEIGLNNDRTINPLITGKILQKFFIEPTIHYKQFIDTCFDFQLKNDYINLFKYLLEIILLNSSKPSSFFNILKENDKLESFIPELIKMDNTMQNPLYHPEGSVYNHTMNVIDNAAKNRQFSDNTYEFMFAALCHDFGKISTTFTKEDGKIVSYGHENQLDESKKFLNRLNIDKKSQEIILLLQKNHMRPFMLFKQNSKLSAINRLKRETGNYFKDLLLLSYCDKAGSGNQSEERLIDLKNYRIWFEEKSEITENRKNTF